MDKQKYIKIKHFKNLILKKLLGVNIHIAVEVMVANAQVVNAYGMKEKNIEKLIFSWMMAKINTLLKSPTTNKFIDGNWWKLRNTLFNLISF